MTACKIIVNYSLKYSIIYSRISFQLIIFIIIGQKRQASDLDGNQNQNANNNSNQMNAQKKRMRTDNYNNGGGNQNRGGYNNNNGGGFGNRPGKVDLRIMLPSKVSTHARIRIQKKCVFLLIIQK